MAAAAAAESVPVPVVTNHAAARYQAVEGQFPGLARENDVPPIWSVRGFLSPAECEQLMEAARAQLKRSIVVDGRAGKSAAPSRTSESCYLAKGAGAEAGNHPTAWLNERVSRLLPGKPASTHEPTQVARYLPGQFYRAHFDAFDVTTGPGRECLLTGGQRVATVLIYLNDVAEGGGTFFPELAKRFRPEAGKAVVFFPTANDGEIDKLALHCAEDAVAEKWVAQIWVRERSFG